jgi:hypothetical protein
MNILAAQAELAILDSKVQDPDFVELCVNSYFSSVKKLAEEQEEIDKKMVEKLLSSIGKEHG